MILIFVFGSCLLSAANPETDFSTQDYINYLNSLQQPSRAQVEKGSGHFLKNILNFDRIEKQINVIFSPERINKGEFQSRIRESKHGSLIVFFVALAGLAVLLYGYRLYPVLIMIFGAWLGSVASYNVLERYFSMTGSELTLFVILGTIIMAIASLLLRNMFVFLFGAAFGVFISQIVLTFISFKISNTLLFVLFLAILSAVLVLLFKKAFMIFFTSLLGGVSIVFSAQYVVLELFEHFSFKDQLFSYSSIVLFLILLIAGIFFQIKANRQIKI